MVFERPELLDLITAVITNASPFASESLSGSEKNPANGQVGHYGPVLDKVEGLVA
jgi:hypothetical protein